MAHRDAICLSSNRKSGIKIACDVNSVTLPKPASNNNNGDRQQRSFHEDARLAALLPGGAANSSRTRRSLVKSCFWSVAIQANPMLQIASGMKMSEPVVHYQIRILTYVNFLLYNILLCAANSSSSLCTSTFGSAALSSASSTSNMPTLNSLAQPVKFKLAARRWRNFTYGRLKRAPKMPVSSTKLSQPRWYIRPYSTCMQNYGLKYEYKLLR